MRGFTHQEWFQFLLRTRLIFILVAMSCLVFHMASRQADYQVVIYYGLFALTLITTRVSDARRCELCLSSLRLEQHRSRNISNSMLSLQCLGWCRPNKLLFWSAWPRIRLILRRSKYIVTASLHLSRLLTPACTFRKNLTTQIWIVRPYLNLQPRFKHMAKMIVQTLTIRRSTSCLREGLSSPSTKSPASSSLIPEISLFIAHSWFVQFFIPLREWYLAALTLPFTTMSLSAPSWKGIVCFADRAVQCPICNDVGGYYLRSMKLHDINGTIFRLW